MALALERLLRTPGMGVVAVTCPPGAVEQFTAAALEVAEGDQFVVVQGGASRQASVENGMQALLANGVEPDAVVLVHDAARALAPPDMMTALVDAIRAGQVAAIPGLAVHDTVKQVRTQGDSLYVQATLPRQDLRIVQTPQAFNFQALLEAHQAATDRKDSEATAATDDAGLMEEMGRPVAVVPGSPLAFKVTTEEDLIRLREVLGQIS